MDHSHREASRNPTNMEQVDEFFVKLRQILNIKYGLNWGLRVKDAGGPSNTIGHQVGRCVGLGEHGNPVLGFADDGRPR